jgi:hypothetical protein
MTDGPCPLPEGGTTSLIHGNFTRRFALTTAFTSALRPKTVAIKRQNDDIASF